MKVDPKSSVAGAPSSGGARPAADGFRLLIPGSAPPAGVAPNAAVSAAAGVGRIDALLALQNVVGPEARQRALRKGRRLLDALDRLQLALLGEGPRQGHLTLLKGALAEQRDPSGDPGLDEALDWAEVRVAVEAAKLSRDPVLA